jgi:rhamnulokinase
VRFLRNIAGWWLLEECGRAWRSESVPALVEAARDASEPPTIFDATDERFLAPASMPDEIRAAAGLDADASPPLVVRAALESMAATTARVLSQLQPHDAIRAFGGGAQSGFFLELLARYADRPVLAGAAEATALGNALTQGVALGVFASQSDARAVLDHENEDALT